MRAPLSWLRDFAPFGGSASSIAASLDDLGLVVEGTEEIGKGLEDVIVARIDEINAIEGADRIRSVVIDAGDGPRHIVCGADNFIVGDLVPLAPIGAVLPDGTEIKQRKMRGVLSEGMLCSGNELGLSSDGRGLMLLSSVQGAIPGVHIQELLGLESDVVFDISIEGNRPDAWSIAGIARDLAARLGLDFAHPTNPSVRPSAAANVALQATLEIRDLELCPLMTVRVLPEVRVESSSSEIVSRLILSGMRPINNVVDASNYVMLELGQPNHPYDQTKLSGPGLIVRKAKEGEPLVTLDGVERILGVKGRGLGETGEDCVICDASDKVVGLGGIMGGASSEITESTTAVLLEVAYFTPMVIARTARRLGLRTEASARFERGCDVEAIDTAAQRFASLLGAEFSNGVCEVQGGVPKPHRITITTERVNRVLGTNFDATSIEGLLSPIGFDCNQIEGGLQVMVPTARPDVRPAPHGIDDVIEEVARTFGYSNLAHTSPSWPQPGKLSARQKNRRDVADVMCGLGANEVWTTSFLSDAHHLQMGLIGNAVHVANPSVADESALRRSMMPGLLMALRYNADRRAPFQRIFEIGTVFTPPKTLSVPIPFEREILCALFALRDDDARVSVDAFKAIAGQLRIDLSTIVITQKEGQSEDDPYLAGLHPTRSAKLVKMNASSTTLGVVGEVDPQVLEGFSIFLDQSSEVRKSGGTTRRVGWLEIDLGMFLNVEALARLDDVAKPISRFPSSDFDLAFLVPQAISAAMVAEALRTACGEFLDSLVLLNSYRGAEFAQGERSLAFRLRVCSLDQTLTDEEVGNLRERGITAACALGLQLR